MDIKITDLDIVDVNIKVAEQFLIKAGVEDNKDRRIKLLFFANQSIKQAIKGYGVDINEVKVNGGSSVKTNPQKQRKVN